MYSLTESKQILLSNYPETFINNIFKKRIHKFYNNHELHKNFKWDKLVTPKPQIIIDNITKLHNNKMPARKGEGTVCFIYGS